MIHLDAITKVYGEGDRTTTALGGISFHIASGEFVSIMGPSGSGKSTLLHILSFLDRPTSGTYTFGGKKMDELTDEALAATRNSAMGFVFQGFNLLSRSTVFENVELPLLYSSVPRHEWRDRAEKAIESVGLTEKMNSEAGQLSGGQQQRVAIARALVNNPDIIFADEPTGNLDSVSGTQVMEILAKLHRDGHTIVLVTHETATAAFAHRLLRLQDGLLAADQPVTNQSRPNSGLLK